MRYLAGVVWAIHWLVRICFGVTLLVALLRRNKDGLLLRLCCCVVGFTFVSQRLFLTDCPLTIIELILRDGFVASETIVNRIHTLKALVALGVLCPAHLLFTLAVLWVLLCSLITLKFVSGAKQL